MSTDKHRLEPLGSQGRDQTGQDQGGSSGRGNTLVGATRDLLAGSAWVGEERDQRIFDPLVERAVLPPEGTTEGT